jgi:hypothetical protein
MTPTVDTGKPIPLAPSSWMSTSSGDALATDRSGGGFHSVVPTPSGVTCTNGIGYSYFKILLMIVLSYHTNPKVKTMTTTLYLRS